MEIAHVEYFEDRPSLGPTSKPSGRGGRSTFRLRSGCRKGSRHLARSSAFASICHGAGSSVVHMARAAACCEETGPGLIGCANGTAAGRAARVSLPYLWGPKHPKALMNCSLRAV